MTPQQVITEIKKQLSELNYNEGDYCLIVYKTIGYEVDEEREVYKVYKTFSVFEQNITKDLDDINKDFGVDIDIWEFDN